MGKRHHFIPIIVSLGEANDFKLPIMIEHKSKELCDCSESSFYFIDTKSGCGKTDRVVIHKVGNVGIFILFHSKEQNKLKQKVYLRTEPGILGLYTALCLHFHAFLTELP